MGRRPDRSLGALVCCSRLAVVFFVCVCLLVLMVATDVANLVPNAAGPAGGGVAGRRADLPTSSPARHSGGRPDGTADAFRSSKRRIPKGPDPIHNRRAGKTTIAPRRRD